jgi:hypothetical protein
VQTLVKKEGDIYFVWWICEFASCTHYTDLWQKKVIFHPPKNIKAGLDFIKDLIESNPSSKYTLEA